MMGPLFRDFWDKTLQLYRTDPHIKYLNPYEHSTQELRKNAFDIFTRAWLNLGYDYDSYKQNPLYLIPSNLTHGMLHMSAGVKIGAQLALYAGSLINLGTKKHQDWARRAFRLEDFGCFLLTEIGHGSNVRGILTRATYDPQTRGFVLHTPHETGAKFWIGSLAETANMGVVFAQLHVDGRNEGVHAFLVELRDAQGRPKPGVSIGDCGTKMGINGADNGWARFDSVQLGADSLLDKYSWFDREGKFRSKIASKGKRFVAQISALSGGRLGIASSACLGLLMAQGIALRFCSVRRQFGNRDGAEEVLTEYPLVHLKLARRLSSAIVYFQSCNFVYREMGHLDASAVMDARVREIHALISFLKTASSWSMKRGFAEARELCGGHGYSVHSNLPVLINDHEVHVTWEGANDVLLQQTCKTLLEEFRAFRAGGKVEFKSLGFLHKFDDDGFDVGSTVGRFREVIASALSGDSGLLDPGSTDSGRDGQKALAFFEACAGHLEVLLELRVYSMVDRCLSKFAYFLTQVKSTRNSFFKSFNQSLPHVLFPAAVFYGEAFCFKSVLSFLQFLGGTRSTPFFYHDRPYIKDLDPGEYVHEKLLLLKMLVVFGLSTLAESAKFMMGLDEALDYDFFDSLVELSKAISYSIRFDLLSLTDVFLPEGLDNSTIGAFDGDIYNNIIGKLGAKASGSGKSSLQTEVERFRSQIGSREGGSS